MKRAGKRQDIEAWMRRYDVDILGIQETQIEINQQEIRKEYLWFYSGESRIKRQGYMVAGVGIVIKKEWAHYIYKIEPVNDRIMYIQMKYSVIITIIILYAFTAEGDDEHKDTFYEVLQDIYNEVRTVGPVYILGDWNARIQVRNDSEENCIGKYTFDNTCNKLA
eukprot:6293450-Karenia_brevis.AAC.1